MWLDRIRGWWYYPHAVGEDLSSLEHGAGIAFLLLGTAR